MIFFIYYSITKSFQEYFYEGSTSDDMPVFLFGLGADTRPAVLLIGKKVLSTLDISNYASTFSLDGFGTVHDCPLDVNSALQFELFGALCLEIHVIEGKRGTDRLSLCSWSGLHGVNGKGCDKSSQSERVDMFHMEIYYLIIIDLSYKQYISYQKKSI